jgi:hypothetical protein
MPRRPWRLEQRLPEDDTWQVITTFATEEAADARRDFLVGADDVDLRVRKRVEFEAAH